MNINQLIAKWRAVVKQRMELDRLSRELKNGVEADLKGQILAYLDLNDIPGVKSDVGFVTRTSKDHLEIRDLNKFLERQMEMFAEAKAAGRPVSDALILQKSPLKSEIASLVYEELGLTPGKDKIDDATFNRVADQYGLSRVSTADLSFRSAQ